MTKPKAYRATVERDGAWWYIFVDGLGHSTQARRLEQVEPMVRDLVALVDGVPGDSFEVEITVKLGDVQHLIDQATEARRTAEVYRSVAAQAMATAARTLRDDGLPMRDIGDLLGLTHQRISQLLAD